MDIADIVSTDFEAADTETPVAKLVGTFDDPAVKAIVLTDDGEYAGVITRK
ncbi:MAG: CBS domain-containing protein [Halobacteriota archaeon]